MSGPGRLRAAGGPVVAECGHSLPPRSNRPSGRLWGSGEPSAPSPSGSDQAESRECCDRRALLGRSGDGQSRPHPPGPPLEQPRFSDDEDAGVLFYPCCSNDWQWPLRAFGSRVYGACFVEETGWRGNQKRRLEEARPDRFRFFAEDARETFNRVGRIGVFVFKCDRPVDGEGSSGICWFMEPLLSQVLAKLSDEAFIVTDGSNSSLPGFTKYSDKRDVPAHTLSDDFSYAGYSFRCERQMGNDASGGYGPVFLWRVTREAARGGSCR